MIRHCLLPGGLPHRCSGLQGCTAGRPAGSGGTAGPAPRALADTGGRTGARAGGGALGSSGSGWRSLRRKRSPTHSSGTPHPTGNPWGKTPDEWTPSDSHLQNNVPCRNTGHQIQAASVNIGDLCGLNESNLSVCGFTPLFSH